MNNLSIVYSSLELVNLSHTQNTVFIGFLREFKSLWYPSWYKSLVAVRGNVMPELDESVNIWHLLFTNIVAVRGNVMPELDESVNIWHLLFKNIMAVRGNVMPELDDSVNIWHLLFTNN